MRQPQGQAKQATYRICIECLAKKSVGDIEKRWIHCPVSRWDIKRYQTCQSWVEQKQGRSVGDDEELTTGAFLSQAAGVAHLISKEIESTREKRMRATDSLVPGGR
jgi:antirestriction protein